MYIETFSAAYVDISCNVTKPRKAYRALAKPHQIHGFGHVLYMYMYLQIFKVSYSIAKAIASDGHDMALIFPLLGVSLRLPAPDDVTLTFALLGVSLRLPAPDDVTLTFALLGVSLACQHLMT